MPSDANVNIDYEAVLADLKAKRDNLDAAIAGIELMLGLRTAGLNPAVGPGIASAASELGPGAFLGMTVVDATVKFLKARRDNQRTEDIVSALRTGGIAFTSENPVNTVGSILNRNWSQGGEIVRVSRGVWGLAEWHPRLRKKGKNGGSSEEGAAPADAPDAQASEPGPSSEISS